MQIISTKKWDALQLQLKAMQSTNLAAAFRNFSTQIFPHWAVVKEINAYQTIDDIYSIVRKLATVSAMIPFYGYDKKTGEDLVDTDKLSIFLETLDFEQKEIMYTNLYLQGEVFMYKNIIEEGVNRGDVKVIFLNPAKIVLGLSETFPVEIMAYKYQDTNSGISFDIAPEEIIFVKYFNPSVDMNDEWRGLSPVKVLARRLTRIQAGEDATVAQMQNGGVPGIVYDKTPGLDPAAIGSRRDNFGRFIRNSENKGAPYFSANDLGYIALGTPLADMEVTALQNVDFDKICNAFGISSILFNNKSASTESNVQEMVKEMYTNTVIPNVIRIEAALNKGVVPIIKTKGIVKCDTSEIDALRENEVQLVTAMASAWWLTGNEKRERMMYDQDTDELMDKYIVPSGMMLLDDLNMIVDEIPNTAGDYQTPVVPLKQASGK